MQLPGEATALTFSEASRQALPLESGPAVRLALRAPAVQWELGHSQETQALLEAEAVREEKARKKAERLARGDEDEDDDDDDDEETEEDEDDEEEDDEEEEDDDDDEIPRQAKYKKPPPPPGHALKWHTGEELQVVVEALDANGICESTPLPWYPLVWHVMPHFHVDVNVLSASDTSCPQVTATLMGLSLWTLRAMWQGGACCE
eukprot:scaffold148994_cov31-Tisochrysis_lutea.AAC.2